jgi:hypothetical protein
VTNPVRIKLHCEYGGECEMERCFDKSRREFVDDGFLCELLKSASPS